MKQVIFTRFCEELDGVLEVFNSESLPDDVVEMTVTSEVELCKNFLLEMVSEECSISVDDVEVLQIYFNEIFNRDVDLGKLASIQNKVSGFTIADLVECTGELLELKRVVSDSFYQNQIGDFVLTSVREALGLAMDGSEDYRIHQLSKSEIFEKALEWEGIIGYSNKIKTFILEIYGIDLDKEYAR